MLPSPFVATWVPHIAATLRARGRHRAFDFAMGRGRHSAVLLDAGFTVFGADRSRELLLEARRSVSVGADRLHLWVADLERFPLPRDAFDLMLCTNYLDRPRWGAMLGTVRAGGFLVYETFTRGQLAHGTGPTSPDHLLEPGELRALAGGWRIVFYEETNEPASQARLVARRPEQTPQ
jgi:hypothetical protein